MNASQCPCCDEQRSDYLTETIDGVICTTCGNFDTKDEFSNTLKTPTDGINSNKRSLVEPNQRPSEGCVRYEPEHNSID